MGKSTGILFIRSFKALPKKGLFCCLYGRPIKQAASPEMMHNEICESLQHF